MADWAERAVPADTTVLVGEPAWVPPEMTEGLAALFRRFGGIEAAYLGWKVTPESGDGSYLLVVVGAPNARETVSDELGLALAPFTQEHPVDVMYAAPGADHVLSGIAPFYRAD